MSTVKNPYLASERCGHLFIIGGGEERHGDMGVLERFVELCGGPDSSIAVLTSASTIPDEMWEIYDTAFSELGVRHYFPIHADSRDQANEPERAQQLYEADGIFMTGGSQKRLVDIIGDTQIHDAMRRVFKDNAACIGGTSAGASAIACHMLAEGKKEKLPDKRTAQVDKGLAFLPQVTIDQHFSERQRLARLLSVIAQHPELIGVGIDEGTALIISERGAVEVIGEGAVTLLDGRHMQSNIADVNIQEHLELINVILHLLPAGNRYDVEQATSNSANSPAKKELIEILRLITRMHS